MSWGFNHNCDALYARALRERMRCAEKGRDHRQAWVWASKDEFWDWCVFTRQQAPDVIAAGVNVLMEREP